MLLSLSTMGAGNHSRQGILGLQRAATHDCVSLGDDVIVLIHKHVAPAAQDYNEVSVHCVHSREAVRGCLKSCSGQKGLLNPWCPHSNHVAPHRIHLCVLKQLGCTQA